MASSLINELLRKGVVHPLTREVVRFPVKKEWLDRGLLKNTSEKLLSLFPDITSIAIISDGNTHRVAAEVLEQQFHMRLEVISIILPSGVKPTMSEVRHVQNMAKEADLLLAVGSGTLNDITKLASFRLEKPYAVFGTAPSMNGYASANASIEESGLKQTLKAHMPSAIFMDTDILSAAPKKLIQSGIGDSLCRTTAQADWMLSYFLLGTDYLSTPFDWLLKNEKRLLPSVERMVKGNPEAVEILAENLILSGLGMALCGGSYPASQGEHMVAHYMEMMLGKKAPPSFHGEQIAVTSVLMAHLQEVILKKGQPTIVAKSVPEGWFNQFFGAELGPYCKKEYEKKRLSEANAAFMNERIKRFWPEMCTQLQKVTLPAKQLHSALKSAGAPTTPEEIGWPKELFKEAVSYALFTRSRFTFLDLSWLSKH